MNPSNYHIVYPTHSLDANSDYSVPRMLHFLVNGLLEEGHSITIYHHQQNKPAADVFTSSRFHKICVNIPYWMTFIRKIEYRFISATRNSQFSFFTKKVSKKHLNKVASNKKNIVVCLNYQVVLDLRKSGVKLPVVLWTHGFDYNHLHKNIEGVNMADLVFYSSKAFVRELRDHFLFEGIYPPFIQLENPFPIDFYKSSFKIDLATSKLVYFFGGGNLNRKGFKIISHLINYWTPSVPTTLLVTGHGIKEDEVFSRGLLEVQFKKFLKGSSFIETISSSAFMLMPSLWFENYPYLLYEGLALGLIPIASRIGGIPELVPESCHNMLIDEPNNPDQWIETLNFSQTFSADTINEKRRFLHTYMSAKIDNTNLVKRFLSHTAAL